MDIVADLRAAWELWRILRSEQLDVLHTHNPKPGVYGRIVGRLAGVPIIVNTVHGLYVADTDSLRKRLVVYALEALAARCSDAELIQNVEDLDLMTRCRITRRNRVSLLGNGIDLTRFNPERFTAESRQAVRNSLGVEADQIVVGAVGRLVIEKGYLDLFEAAVRLGDRYVVIVIGPTDPDKADGLPRAVLDRAATLGVRLLGMREDIDALYSAMDVFALASYREGFPRAAMEATAMGLPVVATDIRGCRQVVDPGVNGLLVPVRSPESLAAAIQQLGADARLRAKMGSAGRQLARDRFDERTVVQTVLNTYRKVARRKGVRLAELGV
jgi:glycosyltransferase involved in cell wall biosynthesis